MSRGRALLSTLSKMPKMYSAPENLKVPMNFPKKLLMGPGPSTAPPRVLAASALPLLGHLHPEFTQIMDDVKDGLRYAFQTKNELVLAVSGTGHAAMETAACNLIEDGDVVMVCNMGLWGTRFADMAERHGADVRQLKKDFGQAFTLEEIEQGLKDHKPVLVFLAQSESSSTVLQPVEGVGALCRKHNALLCVDTVASLGGAPFYMDAWDIDVVYSGAQKVLSAPPGASPICFNERARQKLVNRKTKPRSFYFDMNFLSNYWGCDGEARRYHHTGVISSIYALREGLSMLVEEGLEASWQRHADCTQLFHDGLAKMGLSCFVEDKNIRLPTLTAVNVPEGVNWKEVADFVMDKYKVEISGGLGPSAGKVWRIGVMGYNAEPANINARNKG
ncbi:unnamed protein product, partial [Owenia fusiformis]